jgi:hypothetical protein
MSCRMRRTHLTTSTALRAISKKLQMMPTRAISPTLPSARHMVLKLLLTPLLWWYLTTIVYIVTGSRSAD